MIGAIAGDIIGSTHERGGRKTLDFIWDNPNSHFTDDTVLTIAVADALMHKKPYAKTLATYHEKYPNAGYGSSFRKWAMSWERKPYNSWGNGSAMRVSPVAYAFSTLEKVLFEAARSAEVTHSHPEGIKGAKAVAAAIFLARQKESKERIKSYIEREFGYNLSRALRVIRPTYAFDVSCQGSVPEAIICFLEASDYEEAVRNAISLGGDADTQACIAGSIAEPFFGIPGPIKTHALSKLDDRLRGVVEAFYTRFISPPSG